MSLFDRLRRALSGKTGSAQRVSNELRKSGKLAKNEDLDNGWFVGFAPRDNPEIVVAVLVEAGLHGGTASAPISRDIMKAYFDKKLRSDTAKPKNLVGLIGIGAR